MDMTVSTRKKGGVLEQHPSNHFLYVRVYLEHGEIFVFSMKVHGNITQRYFFVTISTCSTVNMTTY